MMQWFSSFNIIEIDVEMLNVHSETFICDAMVGLIICLEMDFAIWCTFSYSVFQEFLRDQVGLPGVSQYQR